MDSVTAKVKIDLSAIGDDRTTLDGKILFDHNDQPDELELDLTGASVATLNKLLGGAGKPALQRPPVHDTLNHYKQCCPKLNMKTETNKNEEVVYDTSTMYGLWQDRSFAMDIHPEAESHHRMPIVRKKGEKERGPG